MFQCPGCGAKFGGTEQFCPYDGTQLVEFDLSEFEGSVSALEGLKVGNYVLQKPIGTGGMGEVWRAEHPGIGRVVAIKILNADAALQKEAVERFFFEAKAVNRTRHPNLIDIVDWGTLPTGQCYCVMEYLEGQTLAQVLQTRGKIPFLEALPWFLELLAGLSAVHQEGILHRDLKPENVFLSKDPVQHVRVKILDFGVAKLMQSTQELTRAGVAMGTPMFMSPEQATRRLKLDERSDLYAVGVLLYVTITGRYPFTGVTPTRILEKTVSSFPILPREVLPTIDPALESLILRCLEKDREKRFRNAQEMAMALQRFAQNTVTVIAPAKKRRFAALGVLLGLLVLGIVAFGLFYPKFFATGILQKNATASVATPDKTPPVIQNYSAAIYSKPEGAEIFRDEKRLGVTPGSFTVTPGEKLSMRLEGFAEFEQIVPDSGPITVFLEKLSPTSTSQPESNTPSLLKESPPEIFEKKKPKRKKRRRKGKNTPKKKKPIGGLDG